jgi:hypothetical protein
MGGASISKLCKDFSLKSTCISNCCSNGSKNDVMIEEQKEAPHKHHKHKHKHKHHKENEVDVVG